MRTKALLFAALAAALSTGAQAGQYADAMAQCILTNTSASDRDTLTQWAYVTLGKTDAAKKVQAIPAAKPRPWKTRRRNSSQTSRPAPAQSPLRN